MEIRIASDVTHQPYTASPMCQPATVTMSTAQDPVMDQFQQMKFSGGTSRPLSRSKTIHLQLSPLHLEETDFLKFRNETVKLLSEIHYKDKQCKRQVSASQQDTTLQVPEATQATAG